MNRALMFILCSLVLSFGLTTEARACVCMMSFIQNQPCSAYWNANVVFAGTVTEVGPILPVKGSDGKIFSTQGRVTRFKVDEAFRGVTGDMVETAEQGSSCDFHFKQGERYFVYGARNPQDGLIYAHSCSSTKSMQYAAADLEFARALARGDSLPGLVGVVNRETRQSAASYRAQKPMEGIEVVVEGNGRSLTTKTSSDGGFRFYGLASGKYRVTARTPPELRNLYGPEFVDVAITAGRCNGAAFTVTSLATVAGKVVDHITISEGEGYEAPEFRLPAPLAERSVEGIVFLPDGSPVPNALIWLEFTERPGSETASTDNQGRFKLKVFAGYKYLVSAEHRREVAGKWTATHSDPAEVVAGDVTEPLKLIINRAGFYRPVYARQKREVPK